MSSNASSSGIESDIDNSPNLPEEKDTQSISDINNESINTLTNDDDDDEGFINMDSDKKESNTMLENMKQSNDEQIKLTTSKSSHYPYSTQNPYDDDTNSPSVVEDWDEECKMNEPYYFPSYIRRAQWPNHWRWTPPLGIRRTCTQQLHRNLGFEPSGLYDDHYNSSSNINYRHFTFDY